MLFDPNTGPAKNPVLPHREMGAYEALWLQRGAKFKSLAERFRMDPEAYPSDMVPAEEAQKAYQAAVGLLAEKGVRRFGIRVHGSSDYPQRIREAKDPVELLYFQGVWEYVHTKAVAIVGTRKPTKEGIVRARHLARLLVEHNYTVISGLAKGIDTAAHKSAIAAGGRTIAVIGTPIGFTYPKENQSLQYQIIANHLLISQVPIVRYSKCYPKQNKFFFPERNKTMSALSLATVIVEAGETSGTLTQARAALHQGRKLLIMDNLFQRKDLTWPERFVKKGAIRIRTFEDLLENVEAG